jgi:hypothetical protein
LAPDGGGWSASRSDLIPQRKVQVVRPP